MKRDYRTAMMLVDSTNTTVSAVVVAATATTPTNDDEDSVSSDCSTIAVVAEKQQHHHSAVPRALSTITPAQRRVHFNEACNVVVYPTRQQQQQQPTDSSSTWYSEMELRQFKAQTYAMAREIHRLEGGQAQAEAEQPPPPPHAQACDCTFTSVIASAYDACQRVPCEIGGSSPLTPQQARRLLKWMRVGASRWGLERMAVRVVAADRRQRRSGLVSAVLELQAMSTTTTFQRSDWDEVMAKTCQIWSRPSRLFAREMAVAAAAAVVV